MKIKFSQELLTILGYARDEAMRTGCYGIGADHIVLGLLRPRANNASRGLAACGGGRDPFAAGPAPRAFSPTRPSPGTTRRWSARPGQPLPC